MTIARVHLLDPADSRWYHCVTSCAHQDRKTWIERELQELAVIFAICPGGFAVLDDDLHPLVRLDRVLLAAITKEHPSV